MRYLPALIALACLLPGRAAAQEPRPADREVVRRVLVNHLGGAADPVVSFAGDTTHLVVSLRAAAFRARPDSAFVLAARHVAALAYWSYPARTTLVSVTVRTVGRGVPGAAPAIVSSHAYPVQELLPRARPLAPAP